MSETQAADPRHLSLYDLLRIYRTHDRTEGAAYRCAGRTKARYVIDLLNSLDTVDALKTGNRTYSIALEDLEAAVKDLAEVVRMLHKTNPDDAEGAKERRQAVLDALYD